ncbi:MAG: aspartate/glutamate racemase family protein [Endomicrobiaceae bacterium]
MKFGIIGGIGPASTIDYYNGIISRYRAKTNNYPKIVIESINMNEMLNFFTHSDYDGVCNLLASALQNLKNANADYAAIASNTPHIIFDKLKKISPLPLVNIIEETCKYTVTAGYKKVLVLGTSFIMKSGIYENTLHKYKTDTVVPSKKDIEVFHNIIFPNLENGIIIRKDKQKMISLSEKYISKYKINAVILGCTEIPLMIKENELSVPVINTTQIHIKAIADLMVNNVSA